MPGPLPSEQGSAGRVECASADASADASAVCEGVVGSGTGRAGHEQGPVGFHDAAESSRGRWPRRSGAGGGDRAVWVVMLRLKAYRMNGVQRAGREGTRRGSEDELSCLSDRRR